MLDNVHGPRCWPHPGHIHGFWVVGAGSCHCLTAKTALSEALVISLHCFLAVSCAQAIAMALSSVRFGCFNSSSVTSPSREPSMIWSRVLFWEHSSEQKPQVIASSCRETKKSLKPSPSCWVCRRRLCCSTDSLMLPIWRLIAVIMVVMSCFCSTVKPRLLTMARVSRAYTIVAADSSANPERVQYDVHSSFHTSKLEPRSTSREEATLKS